MDWGKFTYLLVIIVIGYAPYKILQKMRRQGLNDISLVTAVLLGVWFCILSWLLFVQAGATLHTTKGVAWLFILTTVVWFLAPFLIRKVGVFPKKLVAEKPSWFVVRFEPRTFYLKYFEVIFQQAKFLFMLFIVLAALPYAAKVFWFTMIIGFLHFNNIDAPMVLSCVWGIPVVEEKSRGAAY